MASHVLAIPPVGSPGFEKSRRSGRVIWRVTLSRSDAVGTAKAQRAPREETIEIRIHRTVVPLSRSISLRPPRLCGSINCMDTVELRSLVWKRTRDFRCRMTQIRGSSSRSSGGEVAAGTQSNRARGITSDRSLFQKTSLATKCNGAERRSGVDGWLRADRRVPFVAEAL